MRKSIESSFGFGTIKVLKDNFIKKGWSTIDEFDSFFEKFCSILEHLNPQQIGLIKELTSEFLWVQPSDYYSYLKKTLLQIAKYPHLNLDTVYVVPLLAKKDKDKTKSSRGVAYDCQGHQLKNNKVFANTTFRIIDDLKRLPKIETLKKSNNPVILIDDFIGTGETANDAIDELLTIRNYDEKTLFVASLVCQNEGNKLISKRGFNVLHGVIRNKGITEKYNEPELSENIKIMSSIEDLLLQDSKFENKYQFGYKSSEALVSLTRTPNNTFPLYWFEAKLNEGKIWKAPFPR